MFRLVEDSFWDDPPIRALPKDEKLIVICLFTNVHARSCGIYRIAIDRIAYMTKVPAAAVAKALRRLAQADIAHYDGLEVCIPGYINKQRYKSPQMARRIVHELSDVKSDVFVKMIVDRYDNYLKIGGKIIRSKYLPLEFPAEPVPDMPLDPPKKKKATGIKELAAFIEDRLRYTGGVKLTTLAQFVEAVGGEDKVRAAVARVEKYYATAKSEKWRNFIIARRFSKFMEFYAQAFSSDDALEEYINNIRAANERERKKDLKDSHLHVGVSRPEEVKPDIAPWVKFMANFPQRLDVIRADFEAFFGEPARSDVLAEVLVNKLLDQFDGEPELETKVDYFFKQLKPTQRTKKIERQYRLNFITHKFNIPELTEEG